MDRIKDINSLLENKSFINFSLEEDTSSIEQWEEYLKIYPEDTDSILKLKSIARFLNSGKKQLPFHKTRYELKELNKAIDFHEKSTSITYKRDNKKSSDRYLWLKIAAVFVLFFSLSILIIQTNLLPYSIVRHKNAENIPTNQILVPLGEKSHVILSDGTEIWLNSGTRLTYPDNFYTGERIVKLEGEAYFDVAKNTKQPFIVKTRQLDVEVLGTSFNLKSYPEEDVVETTLIEGSVKLVRNNKGKENVFYLKPNEKAAFSSLENKMRIYKIQESSPNKTNANSDKEGIGALEKKKSIMPDVIESIVSWKDQVLFFNSENLIDIAKKLERWYGCEITFNDSSMLNETYTGKFVHNEPITMVLDVIKTTTPIEYKIENNKVMIEKK